jgi:1,2-diacylglycerol 3-alpha-glucosyltransferase
MDYTIREIATISKKERPFLLLLGNIDEASSAIITLAQQVLDSDDYLIRSVPYDTVSTYYKASDIFVLSSLQEGFGRVFLEALMHNLPVVAHDHPVMRYVIGEEGILENLQEPGNLAKAVRLIMQRGKDFKNRRQYVRKKFDWQVLSDSYIKMFRRAAGLPVL